MLDRRGLRWFRQLIKMDSNRKPRQVWETRVEGRGKDRIEWQEHLGKKLTRKQREDIAGEGQEDVPVQPDAWKNTME